MVRVINERFSGSLVSVLPDYMSFAILHCFQVTFTRTRYHEAVNRWHWQNKVRHITKTRLFNLPSMQ